MVAPSRPARGTSGPWMEVLRRSMEYTPRRLLSKRVRMRMRMETRGRTSQTNVHGVDVEAEDGDQLPFVMTASTSNAALQQGPRNRCIPAFRHCVHSVHGVPSLIPGNPAFLPLTNLCAYVSHHFSRATMLAIFVIMVGGMAGWCVMAAGVMDGRRSWSWVMAAGHDRPSGSCLTASGRQVLVTYPMR